MCPISDPLLRMVRTSFMASMSLSEKRARTRPLLHLLRWGSLLLVVYLCWFCCLHRLRSVCQSHVNLSSMPSSPDRRLVSPDTRSCLKQYSNIHRMTVLTKRWYQRWFMTSRRAPYGTYLGMWLASIHVSVTYLMMKGVDAFVHLTRYRVKSSLMPTLSSQCNGIGFCCSTDSP